jgi:hypothetical protein
MAPILEADKCHLLLFRNACRLDRVVRAWR